MMNHAFFKALLFMCSGSVIHGVGTEDIKDDQRRGHGPGGLAVAVLGVLPGLAHEGHEPHAEHVEGRHEGGDHSEDPLVGIGIAYIMYVKKTVDPGIFNKHGESALYNEEEREDHRIDTHLTCLPA